MAQPKGGGRPWLAAPLVCGALVWPGAGRAEERQWHALPVAGGTEAVAAAAGLPAGLPAWRVLYEATRRVHGLWGEEAGTSERGRAAAGAAEAVALPLAPEVWRALIGRSDVPDDQLALVILADRRSSLLYRGLAALDEATLAALAAEPQALRAIHREHADVLAAFASRFRVQEGAVALPGGEEAAPLWERLVGESRRAPGRFLAALVAANAGRRAFFYDAVARLDPARQRFALGLWRTPGPGREAAFRALASVFDREKAWWLREGGAFARPEADAARFLREVRLTGDGRLAPPAGRLFWEAVFGASARRTGGSWLADLRASPPAEADWLAAQIGSGDPASRRLRLEQFVFAQRVLAEAGPESLPDAILAVQGLPDARALLLSLERMGARDPALFAAAVVAARRAASVRGREARRVQGALQGAVAVVDRARFAGTLDQAAAQRLLRSLFEVAFEPKSGGCRALAAWVRTALLPDLDRAVYGSRPADEAETTVLRAMAGEVVGRTEGLPVFGWEGLWYRADAERAELARLERVRARQGAIPLAAALRACASGSGGDEPCGAALGPALTSIVYAAHLGDPDGPALAGEDPSIRHDFGSEPWALPEEVSGPGVPWHARGSLLGLERALATLSLHGLAGDALPEEPPVLDLEHRRRLAASVGLVNPRKLADEDRDALAVAMEAGRRRVASLGGDAAAIEGVGRDAGLDPWRVRALEWLLRHEPSARDAFFSLGELLDLGAPGRPEWSAWGVGDEIGAGLGLRLPRTLPTDETSGLPPEPAVARSFVDLGLRVARHLSERRLPAALAPSVAAAVLPELLAEARPVAADDRLGLDAWVRALPGERLDDAVASLVGTGPLLPAPAPGGGR
jgi:hypothetical protein